MRVSPVAYVTDSLEETLYLADEVTRVSHNHVEGMKGAEVTAAAAYLALHGKTKEEIHAYTDRFYPINFTIDEIRPVYGFDETVKVWRHRHSNVFMNQKTLKMPSVLQSL